MKIEINLNDIVSVCLTPEGIKKVEEYNKENNETVIINKNFTINIQLWELINILGGNLFVGCDNYIENNLITINSKN